MNTTCVPIGRQAATLRCTDGIRPRGRVIRTEILPSKEEARASVELDRKGWGDKQKFVGRVAPVFREPSTVEL